jgi:glutathione S-transferase
MLVIWGRNNSINVQKVLWCAEELRVPYKRVDAGLAHGVVTTPEYRAMNPNGLVPTIEDDGLVLWESNAIVRYLAAKHGTGTLWPTDPQVRARADQWLEWHSTTYWPAMRPLFLGLVRTPPERRDPAALEKARQQSGDTLAILDRHLAANAYVAGDSFTAGDIALGAGVWRWFALPIERAPMPNLQRWFDALGARPAYRSIVMLPLT